MVKINPTCDKERVKDLKGKKEKKKDMASTKSNHWSVVVDPVVHEKISLLLTQDKSVP